MIDFIIFIGFLFLGWFLRYSVSTCLVVYLKSIAYYILLIFVVISLWINGFPSQAWQLVMLGALLQLIPSIIGALLAEKSHGKTFLLFSTFGGGNRGTLALSLLSPALLPIFILIDLGNFLSLILFYPLLVMWGMQQKVTDKKNSNISSLFTTLLILVCGFSLHVLSIGLESAWVVNTHYVIKLLLIALTSLQIGLNLQGSKDCLKWTLVGLFRVRIIALALPLLLTAWLMPDAVNEVIPVLLLFSLLPVSSLVVSILPRETDTIFQQQLACAVTASTAIFLVILFFLVMVRSIL